MAKLAHHVFFTLNDRSESSVEHLLSECRKYLDDHDGVVDFSVGVRERELDRPVNGDFDVSLHVVFADRAAHDAYQVSPRHQTFIDDNKANWQQILVLDSTIM